MYWIQITAFKVWNETCGAYTGYLLQDIHKGYSTVIDFNFTSHITSTVKDAIRTKGAKKLLNNEKKRKKKNPNQTHSPTALMSLWGGINVFIFTWQNNWYLMEKNFKWFWAANNYHAYRGAVEGFTDC